MINIKDTEYREKELTELLADTERKMGVNACFTVKDAYNKGLERGKREIESYIERYIIDELNISQANLRALRSYITDNTIIPSENVVDYILFGICDQLEKVTEYLGYKKMEDLDE